MIQTSTGRLIDTPETSRYFLFMLAEVPLGQASEIGMMKSDWNIIVYYRDN